MKKQHYSKKRLRQFLNTDSGIALLSMHAVVPMPFHSMDDAYGYGFDSTLTLGDCGRQITLDFDAYDEKDVKERLKKIDRIRNALNIIEDGLLDYVATVPTKAERNEVTKKRKGDGDVVDLSDL